MMGMGTQETIMWQGWDSGEVSSQREGLRFPGWPLSSTLAT